MDAPNPATKKNALGVLVGGRLGLSWSAKGGLAKGNECENPFLKTPTFP